MPRLSKLELKIMEALWTRGALSIREILSSFPQTVRYTTVQTMVYRLEAKKAVRRAHKVGKAHIFEARVSRVVAQRRLIDEFLALFGSRMQPLMAHLIETGKLTQDDIREAESILRTRAALNKSKRA